MSKLAQIRKCVNDAQRANTSPSAARGAISGTSALGAVGSGGGGRRLRGSLSATSREGGGAPARAQHRRHEAENRDSVSSERCTTASPAAETTNPFRAPVGSPPNSSIARRGIVIVPPLANVSSIESRRGGWRTAVRAHGSGVRNSPAADSDFLGLIRSNFTLNPTRWV